MLNNNIFYHSISRKIIVAFGSLFSNIRIQRKNDGQTEQTIQVPIAYAPKEKWIVRLEQDSTLENHVYTTLPRLSFEITGMNYDATRKMNRMNYITCGDGDKVTRVYSPVPRIFIYIGLFIQPDVPPREPQVRFKRLRLSPKLSKSNQLTIFSIN